MSAVDVSEITIEILDCHFLATLLNTLITDRYEVDQTDLNLYELTWQYLLYTF